MARKTESSEARVEREAKRKRQELDDEVRDTDESSSVSSFDSDVLYDDTGDEEEIVSVSEYDCDEDH